MKIPEYTRNKLVSTMSSSDAGSDRSADILSDAHGRTGNMLANAYNQSANSAIQLGQMKSSDTLQLTGALSNAAFKIEDANRRQQELADQIEADKIAFEYSSDTAEKVTNITNEAGQDFDLGLNGVKGWVENSSAALLDNISNPRVKRLVSRKIQATGFQAIESAKAWKNAAQVDKMVQDVVDTADTTVSKSARASSIEEVEANAMEFEKFMNGAAGKAVKDKNKVISKTTERSIKAFEAQQMFKNPGDALANFNAPEYKDFLRRNGVADPDAHIQKNNETAMKAINNLRESANDAIILDAVIKGNKFMKAAVLEGDMVSFLNFAEATELTGSPEQVAYVGTLKNALLEKSFANAMTDNGSLAKLKNSIADIMMRDDKTKIAKNTDTQDLLSIRNQATGYLAEGTISFKDYVKTSEMIEDAIKEKIHIKKGKLPDASGSGTFKKGFKVLREKMKKNLASWGENADAIAIDLMDDYYDELKKAGIDSEKERGKGEKPDWNRKAINIANKVWEMKLIEMNPKFAEIPDGEERSFYVGNDIVRYKRNGNLIQEVQ